MFYEGDLRSGIAVAVEQSKAVVCFVHDEGDISKQWEHTILNDEQVVETLERNAVALRIAGRSQEAGFLSSFCPVDALPTVIIIQNGAAKKVISASTTSDGMKEGIIAQLDQAGASPSNIAGNAVHGVAAQQAEESSVSSESNTPHTEIPRTSRETNPSTNLSTSSSNNSERQDRVQSSRAAGKKPATGLQPGADSGSQPSSPPEKPDGRPGPAAKSTPRQDWVTTQRARKGDQQKERERIKEQIRRDHEERRLRAQVQGSRADDSKAKENGRPAEVSAPRITSSEVRVQVRTFDGSTLRSKFSKEATISSEIRPWIDATVEQRLPYNLKIILGPTSNRAVEPAEEEKALEDLDLLGSCTLVMVPVKGYVDSYASAGPGIIGSIFSGGYGLLSSSLGAAVNGVSSIILGGQPSSEAAGPSSGATEPVAGTSSRQVKVRTLADQRKEAADRDPQFYNGNQLDFEPRKDDGEEGRK